MDAEGLGRKLLLTPGDPRQHNKMLSLEALRALSMPALQGEATWAGEAFGGQTAGGHPKRPRPFTHYRYTSVATPADCRGAKYFLCADLGGERFLEKCRSGTPFQTCFRAFQGEAFLTPVDSGRHEWRHLFYKGTKRMF